MATGFSLLQGPPGGPWQLAAATRCSTRCAGKGGLVVAKHQYIAVGAVLAAVMRAFFTEALGKQL